MYYKILIFVFICLLTTSISFEIIEKSFSFLAQQNSSAPITLTSGIPYAAQNNSGADSYAYYKFTLSDASADLIISLTGQ